MTPGNAWLIVFILVGLTLTSQFWFMRFVGYVVFWFVVFTLWIVTGLGGS